MSTEIEKLLEERSKTHGPYSVFAKVSRQIKEICSGYNKLSYEHQESIDMILHKIARIVTGNPNVKDHWDDIAGYATLGSKSIKDDGSISKGKTPTAPAQCDGPYHGLFPIKTQNTAAQT